MTDGIVVVDKPAGLTSHDVVARVRRLAGTRRVGHAGTLDPMATGVLVLGVGRGTRMLGHLAGTDKSYEATIRLGAATTTDDAEGVVTGGAPAGGLDENVLRSAVAALVGPLDQVPSSVSAVKVAGERAHAIVRRGGQVDLPARRVQVYAFEVDRVSWSGDHADLDVRVHCSSGTYIRALARDLGAGLAVGGHLTRLRRTRVGAFTLAAARTLEQLAGHWEVQDLTTAALVAFPSIRVGPEQAQGVRHGARLDAVELPTVSAPVAVLDPDGAFLALYAAAGDDATSATAVAVFVG